MNEIAKAIRTGDGARLRELFEETPALARQKDALGVTPLHEAVDQRRIGIIELLLRFNAEIDAKDKYGHTPLFRAAWQGNAEIVDLLLKHGADINTRDHSGHSLLHWAAFQGHVGMLQMLLERGAEPDARNVEGKTPIDYAAEQGRYEAVELISRVCQKAEMTRKKNALKYETIGEAIDQGDLEGVRQHLRYAEEFHPAQLFDHTLLIRAASAGNPKILGLLLEKGANVNVQGSYGLTPLHVAAGEGRKEVVKALIDKGADLNMTDFENKTPVQLARERGHLAIAKWLASQKDRQSGQLQEQA